VSRNRLLRWTMDLHGAPMSRTWLKLGATAKAVTDGVTERSGQRLAQGRSHYRHAVGPRRQRYVVASSRRQGPKLHTEERIITAIDGTKIEFEQAAGTSASRRRRTTAPRSPI